MVFAAPTIGCTLLGLLTAFAGLPSPTGDTLPLVGLRQDPADPTTKDAADAFTEGEAAYADRDFARAADAFAKAQQLAPHPDTEFNLGLALARDNRELEAWTIFDRLRTEAPTAELRDDASEQLALVRARVAVLEVIVLGPEVVCIDGMRQAPRTQWVMRPGPHRVEAVGLEQTLHLRAGETRRFDLRFVHRTPTPPPSYEAPRAVAPLLGVGATGAAAATAASVVAIVENHPGVARGWTIGAATAGGIALGTVVAALTLHIRAKRRARSSTPAPPPQRPRASCPDPGADEVLVRSAR